MFWLPYSSHTSHHPSQTPGLPRISYATQKLMLDSCKMVEKQSEAFHTFLWRPDCIFEILQLWQSGFSRVYSNCCCSCSFGPEIIKIGQSSHKMYNNNIVNFQESSTILNDCTKNGLETYWRHLVHVGKICLTDFSGYKSASRRRLMFSLINDEELKFRKYKLFFDPGWWNAKFQLFRFHSEFSWRCYGY